MYSLQNDLDAVVYFGFSGSCFFRVRIESEKKIMLDTYRISKMVDLSHRDLMTLIGVIQNHDNFYRDHEIALVENAFFDFIAYYFSDDRGHNRHYRAMWINDGPSHDRFDEFGWWRGGYGVIFGWSKIVETQGFAEIYNPKRWDGSTYKGESFVSSHWTSREGSEMIAEERENLFPDLGVKIVELAPLD